MCKQPQYFRSTWSENAEKEVNTNMSIIETAEDTEKK
jgi:hypothetical protein